MDNDLKELIEQVMVERCCKALKEDVEYLEVMSRAHDHEEELEVAIRAVYKRCLLDCIQLYTCSQKM